MGFVRTMDGLRGMKLVRKDGEKNYAISIKVDFDTTKHLSEANIKRRKVVRDRLLAKENLRLEDERKKQEAIEATKEKERFEFIIRICGCIEFIFQHTAAFHPSKSAYATIEDNWSEEKAMVSIFVFAGKRRKHSDYRSTRSSVNARKNAKQRNWRRSVRPNSNKWTIKSNRRRRNYW